MRNRMLGGDVGEEDAATTPLHTTASGLKEIDRCLAAVKLPKALPISWAPVLPMLLTALSQSLQTRCGRKPCLEDGQSHHWWLSLGGSSRLLFCAGIFAFCDFFKFILFSHFFREGFQSVLCRWAAKSTSSRTSLSFVCLGFLMFSFVFQWDPVRIV